MRLTVTDFQSLGAVEVEVSGLTVLVGPSNRGKSALIGTSAPNMTIESPRQAARQPRVLMRCCAQGSNTMEPIPTPENAMPSASPRRRTNQLGMKRPCPV